MSAIEILILALIGVLSVALVFVAVRARRAHRRGARLGELLDELDGLESDLAGFRQQMAAVDDAIVAEGAEATFRPADPEAPLREAKRGVLAHRLWIRSHGLDAPIDALDNALERARAERQRLRTRLGELADASDALAAARRARSEDARGNAR